MPTSNNRYASKILKTAEPLRITISLLLTALICVWLSQNSINAYWQEKLKRNSWLQPLDQFAIWRVGGKIQTAASEYYKELNSKIEKIDEQIITGGSAKSNKTTIPMQNDNSEVDPTQKKTSLTEENTKTIASNASNEDEFAQYFPIVDSEDMLRAKKPLNAGARDLTENESDDNPMVFKPSGTLEPIVNQNKIRSQSYVPIDERYSYAPIHKDTVKSTRKDDNNRATTPIDNTGSVWINSGDTVFFVGDSLMQGVAPFLQRWLQTQGVKSINLSKQSTGLSYPKNFDWPGTVEKTFAEHPEIRLVIVFMGANDPWDFPDPKNPTTKFLRFSTPDWENEYASRIESILNTANPNAKVIWLGIPQMRKPNYNEKMMFIDEVIRKTVSGRAIYIPTKKLLSGNSDEYMESLLINGKQTKLRTKDGIHFSVAGQKIIAQAIQEKIRVRPLNNMSATK